MNVVDLNQGLRKNRNPAILLIKRCVWIGSLILFTGILTMASVKEIIAAAKAGNAAKIESLLAANPELVNAKGPGLGATALHWAAIYGRKKAVAVLLRHGADPNVTEGHNGTAMHWAAHHDDPEVIEWFLDKGADIDHANKMGRTPLHVAARRGCLNVAKKLIERGADIHATINNGGTALHVAARNGHKDVIEVLISAGVSQTAKNKQGKTYLELVYNRPQTTTVDPQLFDAYAGVYKVEPNLILRFMKENDRLYLYGYGRDELLPLSENKFITSGELEFFSFLRDEKGVVKQVKFKSPHGELIGNRID
jgi:ankyrin repeat protein